MRYHKILLLYLFSFLFFLLYIDAAAFAATILHFRRFGFVLETTATAALAGKQHALSHISDTSPDSSGASALAEVQPHTHPSKHMAAPVQDGDFIKADGFRLVDSKGKTFFVQGMNYWSCMTLASGEDAGGDLVRLRTELDQLAKVGVNALRIMAAVEGAETRQPNRIYPPLQTSPGHWDERVFVGLDTCIAEASKRGMRLIMTMGNTWQWSGGISQQVAWSSGKQDIPYPPAWDLSLPPQRTDGHPGWGNYSTGGDYSTYMAYQEKFYTDEGAQKIYKAHLDKVMSRVNTVTKRNYSQDAAILAWEPLNEPQKTTNQPAGTSDTMITWHHAMSDYIKQQAPGQMTTTGYEAKFGEEHFKELHDHKSIDFNCAHLWVQNWGHYDMLDSTDESLTGAKDFARSFIKDFDRWSTDLGKPILLEEFGMARDVWHNNVSRGQYQYDCTAPTTHRDSYFSMIYALVKASFAKVVHNGTHNSIAGIMPWSYGGIFRSATQEYTKYDIILAGDPPQEPPCWYSILDTDIVMQKIAADNEDIQALLHTNRKHH